MKKLIYYIYTAWSAFVFGILLLLAAPVYFLCDKLMGKKGIKYMLYYNKLWVIIWAALTGIRHKIIGLDKVDGKQSYVFVTNHTSMLDATALNIAIWKHTFSPFAKIELRKAPIVGYLFSKAGIYVDRSDPDSRKKSVVKMKAYLKQGISVQLFPEGTRNKEAKVPLTPFKSGAFRTAIDLQLPIVPIVLVGIRKAMPDGKLPLRPCTITAIYSDPIPTKGLTQEDAIDLKEQTFKIMEELILEHDKVD